MQTPYNPNPRDCGGPENSLTLWGDQGNPNAILADYGNAYSFMLFLYDRYGIGLHVARCTATATTRAWSGLQARSSTATRRAPTSTTCCTTSRR